MNSRNITGRDSYIISQALAYASEWMRTLNKFDDEPSNRHDMDRLLAAYAPGIQHVHRTSARDKLRNRTAGQNVDWIAIQIADMEETKAYLAEEAAEWTEDGSEDASGNSDQSCRSEAAATTAEAI